MVVTTCRLPARWLHVLFWANCNYRRRRKKNLNPEMGRWSQQDLCAVCFNPPSHQPQTPTCIGNPCGWHCHNQNNPQSDFLLMKYGCWFISLKSQDSQRFIITHSKYTPHTTRASRTGLTLGWSRGCSSRPLVWQSSDQSHTLLLPPLLH